MAKNFKSNEAYQAWLAYGHASGEFAKTPGNQEIEIKGKKKKVKHALGGDLGADKNTPYPYFLISATGQITHFENGGELEEETGESPNGLKDIFGALGGASLYSMVGSGVSDMIGGETNIAEDRTKGKEAGIASGIFSGAGQGAAMGSALGPWGTAAGAVIGGIAGGITGAKRKDAEISALKESMTAKYADLGPMTTQYLGAYGLDLDPNGDPPVGVAPTAPPKEYSLEELQAMTFDDLAKQNPNDIYKLRLQAHKDWSTGYRNPDTYNYQLTPAELQTYIAEQKKTNPNVFIHTGEPVSMYVNKDDKNQLDYANYFPQYAKPVKPTAADLEAWKTASASTTPPVQPKKEVSYLNPHTGQPLDPAIYGRPTGSIDEQFSQGAELTTRKLENIQIQQDQDANRLRNEELITRMSKEDLDAARNAKMTPYKWLESQKRLGEYGLAYGGPTGPLNVDDYRGPSDFSNAFPAPYIGNTPLAAIDLANEAGAHGLSLNNPNTLAALTAMSPEQRKLATKGIMDEANTPSSKAFSDSEYERLNKYRFGLAYGGGMGEEMRFTGEATEYNGMRHEDGGIAIGDKEVEDGEIRVGDYVFSDRLLDESGRTFAAEAKKITDRYAEYGDDAAAKRTQSKYLEDLKYRNDQARLLKQKEDAEMKIAMGQDYAAYGGMISQDESGKYIVDKTNRMALMDAAKNHKMSYSKYIDSLYKYGGDMVKETLANGGDPKDPYGLLSGLGTTGNYTDILPAGTGMGNPFELPSNFGVAPQDTRGLLEDPSVGQITGLNSPTADLMSFFSNASVPTVDNPETEGSANSTQAGEDKNYWQKVKENFGKPEAGLLAANLPAISNLIGNMKPITSKFDRVDLDEISLEAERQSLAKAVDRARKLHRENVRGTATSSGEALAALSAGNAGLTAKEMDSLSEIANREKNMNIQVDNQEKLTNVNIANQEHLARQQDEAMKATVRSAALANISENTQGYFKDKSLIEENAAANKRLLSLLDSGEYQIVPTEDGGYKVVYKNSKEATTKETKETK